MLAGTFLLALVFGAGPGIVFANRPETWWGLPQLYVWGAFWCGVETLVVVIAYLFLWKQEDTPASRGQKTPSALDD